MTWINFVVEFYPMQYRVNFTQNQGVHKYGYLWLSVRHKMLKFYPKTVADVMFKITYLKLQMAHILYSLF